jgi:formate-dependent phosphoribosylglycinamide formyltransferase (GAR transformylase)
MSYLLKDPGAVLDYLIDWGAEYLSAGELIAASEWSIIPDETGGVTVAGSDFDATTSTVKAAGGVAGHVYQLVNRITTGAGRVDERSIAIRVEDR